jgi:hypothetical protein
MSKITVALLAVSVSILALACGGASEPAKEPPPAGAEPAPAAAPEAPPAAAPAPSAAPAPGK